jgi:nicotinate-nucleotide--dimethylbenzimidazole phosphoribosyltransferase
MNRDLESLIESIQPLDVETMQRTKDHLNSLTKPMGSLGRLEELAEWLAGVMRQERPRLPKKVIFTFAADHGVTAEGVSAYPAAVTAQMVHNFLRGGAAINVLARQAEAEVLIADFGVATEFEAIPGLLACKIAPGTANMAKGPAMSEAQAVQAILAGVRLAQAQKKRGASLFATGEMGIGNTTSASALVAGLTGTKVEEVTGSGTGIDEKTFRRKVQAIQKALEVNQVKADDPLGTLAKVGGFEIAGLVGVILAGAASHTPVVIDGFISGAAALVASRLASHKPVADYLAIAHLSAERGHHLVARQLALAPLLDFHMRLGEGTGAALVMPILDAACAILNEMATFQDAGVSQKNEKAKKRTR